MTKDELRAIYLLGIQTGAERAREQADHAANTGSDRAAALDTYAAITRQAVDDHRDRTGVDALSAFVANLSKGS